MRFTTKSITLKLTSLALVTLCIVFYVGANDNRSTKLTKAEIKIINSDTSSIMKVYTVDNPSDTVVLRAKSINLSDEDILGDNYRRLCQRMIKTVIDSTQGGVGIAAPQVGINRRMVVVQRFDKPEEPFEAYPNIYIKEYSQEIVNSPEGCLSVPDKMGLVPRSAWVIISHTNPTTLGVEVDTVKGFTAIIFQHEIDHLDGIIYTDRIPATTL